MAGQERFRITSRSEEEGFNFAEQIARISGGMAYSIATLDVPSIVRSGLGIGELLGRIVSISLGGSDGDQVRRRMM